MSRRKPDIHPLTHTFVTWVVGKGLDEIAAACEQWPGHVSDELLRQIEGESAVSERPEARVPDRRDADIDYNDADADFDPSADDRNIWWIFASKLPEIEKKLAKLQERFGESSGYKAALTVLAREMRESKKKGVGYEVVKVKLTLEQPPAAWHFNAVLDHSTGADAGLTIIRRVPGTPELPHAMRTRKPYCDHCGRSIDRRSTYVVYNDAHEQKSLGGDCLRAYLGEAAMDIVKGEALFTRVTGMLGDASWGGGGGGGGGGAAAQQGEPMYKLVDVLGYVALCIDDLGWRSRGGSVKGTATADYVLMYMGRMGNDDDVVSLAWQPWARRADIAELADIEEMRKELAAAGKSPAEIEQLLRMVYDFNAREVVKSAAGRRPPPQDPSDPIPAETQGLVADALDWIRAVDPNDTTTSEYMHNLRVVAGATFIGKKAFGLAASLIPAYRRHLGDIEKAQQARHDTERRAAVAGLAVTGYFGQIDQVFGKTYKKPTAERPNIPYLRGVVTFAHPRGVTKIQLLPSLEDPAAYTPGYVLTWYGLDPAFAEGTVVEFSATIKRHEMYKPPKAQVAQHSTIIQAVKIRPTEEDLAAAAAAAAAAPKKKAKRPASWYLAKVQKAGIPAQSAMRWGNGNEILLNFDPGAIDVAGLWAQVPPEPELTSATYKFPYTDPTYAPHAAWIRERDAIVHGGIRAAAEAYRAAVAAVLPPDYVVKVASTPSSDRDPPIWSRKDWEIRITEPSGVPA